MTIIFVFFILELLIFICSVIFEKLGNPTKFFSAVSLVIVGAALIITAANSTTQTNIETETSSSNTDTTVAKPHMYKVVESTDTTIVIIGVAISTTTDMQIVDTNTDIYYTIVVPTEDKLEAGTAFEATLEQFKKDFGDNIKSEDKGGKDR